MERIQWKSTGVCFYTKYHVQALKSTLNRYILNIQFILQNILKMFITKGICFNATLTHGNCSERWVAPVLCEWGSVPARAKPAAAPALRGEGSRSRGEGRTRKQ